MAKWTVTVVETVTKYVDVFADSREDAIDAAENSPEEDFYGHNWDAPEAVDAEELS
jgi:hypothetical protein